MPSSTLCPFCAVGCGLTVEPAEPVPRFRGDAAHPVNHGALCARGAAATFEVSSRERLLTPLRRSPGQREWTTIAWDEALDIVSRGLLDARARTFDAARAAATGIGFFGGATAMNEEVWLFVRLARLLGVLDLDHQGRTCHAATTAALGATLGITGATHDWSSLLDARSIVIIGANPADAHPIAARYLHGARARGAKVTVIDPRASRTAQGADLHLSLRPGTDLMLLCGLISQVLARQREDTAWLEERSDAGILVDAAAEIDATSGRFGGWDASRRGYDTRLWSYHGQGRLTDASSVLSALRRHFARYTEAMVCAVTGLHPDDVRVLADRVCDAGPTAVIFSMGVTQQLSGVATVRAAAILQALLGNLERAGGGLYPMKGHANIQGATDLGGLYHHMPGAIPAPTVDEPDLGAYAARYGEAPARHLRRLLRVWAADEAEAAYARLPKRRDGDHHSLHAALARGDLEVVMLLGQNPVHGSGNPRAVEQALGRLRLLVSIDPFLNETARFWERVPGCATEVLALPSAMFAEKPGSRTNACRRVQWQNACLAPRGDSRPDGVMLRDIWTRIAAGLQMGRGEGAASEGAPDDAESTDVLYRRLHREITAGCWLWDEGRADSERPAGGSGKTRLNDCPDSERPASGERGETGETGELGEPGETGETAAHTPSRGRRVRLWAGPCELDGWRLEAIPDGPLPEYYAPPGAGDNPLHPAQAVNPLLEMDLTSAFPLTLSTAMSETDGRRCAPATGWSSGGTVAALEVRATQGLAARLGLDDGAAVWLETPQRRAPAVLRVVEGEDRDVVWAPSFWSEAAGDAGFHAVIDPGDRHTLLDDLRLTPCRLERR